MPFRDSMQHIKRLQLFFASAAFLAAMMLSVAPKVLAYNNPSLEWRTITTEHFEVHYHQDAEWTAQQVAAIAEEVHGPLCDLYGYEPSTPVHFIIRDTDDYANGAAYFFDNKVEIWATNLEFYYRGTTQWLRNVVTHEYGHIVSIQAAMKMTTRVPAIYFQVIGFEEERRPDVLQGYPNNIISYPFSGIVYPPWFAEGVSQFQTPTIKYDCWDTHRDMILRCGVLDNMMLTYDEMGFFGKTSMQGEQVYDHGFGLVNFIAATYGAESIDKITHALRAPWRLNMDGALKKVTGKKGEEIYDDWRAYLEDRYEKQTAGIRDHLRTGTLVVGEDYKKAYLNVQPVFSPDGRTIAFMSNAGNDYARQTLYTIDRFGKNRTRIRGGVNSAPRFSDDGKKILYSRKHKIDKYGSLQNDVFIYDIETKKEKQLTRSARIGDADFSRDGKSIIGVKNGDGTHRLIIMDADGKNERVLLEGPKGTQFYTPHYSPDGSQILFGIFEKGTRDIAVVSNDGTGFRYLLETPNDERNAQWNEDGTGVMLACDRTGIFNLYEVDLENGTVAQLTNVIGGAFMPDDSPGDGAIAYSHYSGNGYSVYLLDGGTDPVATMDMATFVTRDAGEFDECANLKSMAAAEPAGMGDARISNTAAAVDTSTGQDTNSAGATLSSGAASPDPSATGLPVESPYPDQSFETSKYNSRYSIFQLFPRIVVWDNKLRLGLFMMSNEILDKQSLFIGGALGTNKEYDAYISYEIRNFYPTLFADFVVLRELHSDASYDEETGSEFIYDTQYDLWQADIGMKLDLSEPYALTFQHQLAAYWSHGEYRVHLEGDEIRYGDYFDSFKGGWKYYTGNEGILRWTLRSINPAVDADINPRGGRQVSMQYLRSWNKLFTTGEFEYGFKAILTDSPYNQFTIDWREYIGLPFGRNSLGLRLYGSVIDRNVDDFFWIYVGGRDFNRGYSYYSIGGRKAALASLTYRFPVLRNINKQLLNLYFRDFYVGLFCETSNAWEERGIATTGWKNSVGVDLRLSLGSYYMFPTSISFLSAYAMDPVETVLYGFGQLPLVIRQERGWRFYTTVGFGFDL
jgi:hypothetical protein